MTDIDNDDPDAGLAYWISLQVRHPTLHPTAITAALGMKPKRSWFVGEPRTTPKGTPLGGTYDRTYWVTSTKVTGHRFFFKEVITLIQLLELSREFISEFVETGGTLYLNIGLGGCRNIGDVIRSADLRRLCDLGIDLGVEVYP